jgi:hypothetical protein
MSDCVLDASIVAYANGDLKGRRPGNLFHRRLRVIEQVCEGDLRLRYHSKLLREYQQLIRAHRNDVIEVFFAVLDSERTVLVPRNVLSRQDHACATRKCRWPSHDQHLLAAALDGDDPRLFVTEEQLAVCAPKILTYFSIRVRRLA